MIEGVQMRFAQRLKRPASWWLPFILLAGCAPRDDARPPPVPRVTISEADKPTLERVIFRNTGRVVLVSFWATWDAACQRQFSHVKVLQDVYGPQGFQVVAVSLDDPMVVRAVTDFLSAQRAGRIVNLISVYGADPQSYREFEIPSETVPCYLLYDRMGNLKNAYSGSLVGIEPKIRELIEQTDFELEDAMPKGA